MKNALLALALLAAPRIGSASATASAVSVPWFDGSVEDAFAAAEAQGRPLFLYWGAVWCPPCNQIKATIFNRREFAEKMKLFVPVYLDGDTERAQIWGEKLKTKGYPTMILLNPDGVEVMRMASGLQLMPFLETLDQALQAMTPVQVVLKEAMAATSAEQVKDASWRLLAYYSWGQDAEVGLSDAELAPAFEKLASMAPERMPEVRSRLFAIWLQMVMSQLGEKDGVTLSGEQRVRVDQQLRAILASRALTMANLQFLSYSAGDTVKKLYPEVGPDRTRIMTAWEDAMRAIENDATLSVDERISAVIPSIEFNQIARGDQAVPPLVQDRVRKLAAWADEAATDDYTRQSSLNTAGHLLQEVGLDAEAKALYLRQVEKAPSPHYFMSSLSSLAKKAGNKAEAIEWLKQAYDTSKGRATRFQWGSSYLLGLLDLVPKDDARISAESLRVLTEVLSFDDAFAGRNTARISRLKAGYAKWNGKAGAHQKTLDQLSLKLSPQCGSMPEAAGGGESQRGRCSEFFGTLGRS